MALRIPNLGTGNGSTGDNELKIRQDYNHNFSDQSNAASRLVGTEADQIPLAEDTFKASFSRVTAAYENNTNPPLDLNNFEAGTNYLLKIVFIAELNDLLPNDTYIYIETKTIGKDGQLLQIATGHGTGQAITRIKTFSNLWSPWIASNTNGGTYLSTTAQGANVVVDSSGKLRRSTSSERYKDILSNVVLDDAMYNKAINEIQPIVYRSTADADNSKYHYYSFSAEKVGAFDPALALWRETETVTDEDGNTTERKLDERQAEGLNINGLLALQYAMIVYQHNKQVELESRIGALEQSAKG